MTDKEEHHPRSPRKHAPFQRGRPGQSRIFHHLGVRDLREIIDRKRGERGELTGVPPDSSYNYLKDPLRENEQNEESRRQPNTRTPRNPGNSFRREKDHNKASPSNHPRQKDIEHPLNIKVEFSTATGEHSYQVDESTVLPTIKHVPDHPPTQNRPFRGRGRGRGRGRARGYQTRTIRNNTRHESAPMSPHVPEADWDAEIPEHTESHIAPPQEWDLEPNENKEEYNEEPIEDIDEQHDEVGLEQSVENLKLKDESVDKQETKE